MLPGPFKWETAIAQDEVNKFIPPYTSIGRGLVRCEWCGHCPPRQRISAAWAEHTEHGAMTVIVRQLWTQWLQLHGLEDKDCPVADLF